MFCQHCGKLRINCDCTDDSGFIGNPNVPAIVHAAERFNGIAQAWAEELYEELLQMADSDYDTKEQQIREIAKTLKNFAEGEIAWRNAGQ